RLKDVAHAAHPQWTEEVSKDFSQVLRFSYYDSADPLLLFLFRGKSVKESESQRLSLLLAAMQQQSLTALELLEILCSSMTEQYSLPDEKTIRSDLKYLEQVGVIKREPGARPYRYRLNNDLITSLSYE